MVVNGKAVTDVQKLFARDECAVDVAGCLEACYRTTGVLVGSNLEVSSKTCSCFILNDEKREEGLVGSIP